MRAQNENKKIEKTTHTQPPLFHLSLLLLPHSLLTFFSLFHHFLLILLNQIGNPTPSNASLPLFLLPPRATPPKPPISAVLHRGKASVSPSSSFAHVFQSCPCRFLFFSDAIRGLFFHDWVVMESRVVLSAFCSNSSTTTLRAAHSIKLQASVLASHSLTHIQNSLSFKTRTPRSLNLSSNRFECVKMVGKVRCGLVDSVIRKKKLAIFVSGGGSNFKSLHEACFRGSILGEIVALVTNNPGCGGAEYARSKEIPVILFPKTKDAPDGLSASDVVTALRTFDVDFVLLAGYLKLIPIELVQAYPRRILNIHPSLLPAFGGKGYYGMKVHKAVVASGARYSGPTIHFVDEHYDTGCILAQRIVPVLANDSAEELAARVLKEEHQLYVKVTEALCEERILWREDGVPLIQSRENPNEYS